MADPKIVKISEAKEIMPSSFPSASGDELNRCPTKSELVSNGFTINTGTRTYDDNQCVVITDLGSYDISYELSNAQLHYNPSTRNFINAAGSDNSYAYITATVTKKQGSTTIWSSATTLNAQHTGSESYMFVSGDTYIKAIDRGGTSGGTRTDTFRGYYGPSDGDRIVTSNFTVVQQENEPMDNYITTGIRNVMLLPSDSTSLVRDNKYISYLQGIYHVIAQEDYKHWVSYTSGYNSDASKGYDTGSTTITASTYSDLGSWLYLNYENTKQFKSRENTNDSNRNKTITARFITGTDSAVTDKSVEAIQYRKPYNTYDMRVINVSPTSITWQSNQYGSSFAQEISATFQFATSTWKDGTRTTGAWTNYTPSTTGVTLAPFARFDGQYNGRFKFYKYDGTSGYEQMDFYYDTPNSSTGKVRVYPYSSNTSVTEITAGMKEYFSNPATVITDLKQSGTIAFTIDPESLSFTYNGGTKKITATTVATDWTVSENAGWFTATKNGNEVTVVVDENTNTGNPRSDYVKFMSGTTQITSCKVTQEAAPIPEPSIPGIDKLYTLGDGWIVGRYAVSKSQTPYYYQIVIVREDPGVNTHFSFASDGYYQTHSRTSSENHIWQDPPLITYGIDYQSGGKFHATDVASGIVIDCYGISIPGAVGQQAETQSAYGKITYYFT